MIQWEGILYQNLQKSSFYLQHGLYVQGNMGKTILSSQAENLYS